MSEAKRTVIVNEYTNGILGPQVDMLGPVQDGGTIIANTAPGCWGPMISPCIRGGHIRPRVDIRPRVVDALNYLVGRIKDECVTEMELN